MVDMGIKQLLQTKHESRVPRTLKLPLLYTQSLVMTAAAESKGKIEGLSPAVELAKVLEVVETRRRNFPN